MLDGSRWRKIHGMKIGIIVLSFSMFNSPSRFALNPPDRLRSLTCIFNLVPNVLVGCVISRILIIPRIDDLLTWSSPL